MSIKQTHEQDDDLDGLTQLMDALEAEEKELSKESSAVEKVEVKETPAVSEDEKVEVKKPKKRVFFSKVSDRILDLVGTKSETYSLLTTEDAKLKGAKRVDHATAFYKSIDTEIAKKVREKLFLLLKFLEGKGELNYVMKTAFELMAKDGKLTTGKDGNLQKELRKKYSVGTAQSQANQMFMLFPFMKIAIKSDGVMTPNAESIYLAEVNKLLGL